jgi:hypothetical protein
MSKGAGVRTRKQMPAPMVRRAEIFSCCCIGGLFAAHMRKRAEISTPAGAPRKERAALRQAVPPSKVPIGKVKKKKKKVLENGNGFAPTGNISLHSGVAGQSLLLFIPSTKGTDLCDGRLLCLRCG